MAPRSFVISSPRGLGTITQRELTSRTGTPQDTTIYQARNVDLLVVRNFNGETKQLMRLATAEDIFLLLRVVELSGTRIDLRSLQLQTSTLTAALTALTGSTRVPKHVTYRVVVQAQDDPKRQYRRVDMGNTLTQAVASQVPGWRPAGDEAQVELWIHQVRRQALISLRISDKTMRHRTYKTSHIEGSLRPVIAATLAYLSRPKETDIVMDPMCGAGTILIERAMLGQYKNLIAGDIDADAIEATKANFGPRHRPREFRQWDTRKLPLPNVSVDKIITNPPWGRQMGSPEYLQSLYNGFIREAERVLKPSGMMVVLTSETSLLKSTLAKCHQLQLVEQVRNVYVLGWPADIFVIMKKATA